MSDKKVITLLRNTEKEFEMSLYDEIGQFFSVNGIFDEKKFADVLTLHISENIEDGKSKDKNQGFLEKYVSDYVDSILSYLTNKGMLDAASKLFDIAIAKCKSFGINRITISPSILERILKFDITKKDDQEAKKTITLGEKKNRIFKAALKVFSEDGFYRATMDKIASLSGVGKGSLYRYFKSKEELLEMLLEEEYKGIVESITEIFNKNTDIIDGLIEMVEYWVNFINDNHIVYNLIQSADVTTNTLGGKTRFYKYMSEHLPLLKAKIVSLNKEAKVKGINYLTVIYGMFGFVDGVVHKWFGSDMAYPLTDEIPVILETLFNGCVGEQALKRKFVNVD